jgi:hypothetical protein
MLIVFFSKSEKISKVILVFENESMYRISKNGNELMVVGFDP